MLLDGRCLLSVVAGKNNHPKTTKPLHFCEGFVLYGVAPGVENLHKHMVFCIFLCWQSIYLYLDKYPYRSLALFTGLPKEFVVASYRVKQEMVHGVFMHMKS